jgi:hypothetical protein
MTEQQTHKLNGVFLSGGFYSFEYLKDLLESERKMEECIKQLKSNIEQEEKNED